MHNVYPQMGRFEPQLGCLIYDETPQMGAISVEESLSSLIKNISSNVSQSIPGLAEQGVTNWLQETKEGQAVLTTAQKNAIALGEKAAAQQAAQQTLAMKQQLEAYYMSVIGNLKANWQKYLMWGGVAVVGVFGLYMIAKSVRKTRTA